MARAFRFSLQPLLDQKAGIENEHRRQVAAARRALDEAREALERLMAAVAAQPYLDAAIAAQLRSIAELQGDLERRRHDLVAAARERKVIEHLRVRRRRSFEAEEARQEELELDESNARCRQRAARDRPPDCRTQRTTA
jgi:flagellar biosynthesis chaperone FliJ